MKTIAISIRLSPKQIALALDALRAYNKAFYPESISHIVKETYNHGLATLTGMLSTYEPSEKSLNEISRLSKQVRDLNYLEEIRSNQIEQTDKNKKQIDKETLKDQMDILSKRGE